MARELYKENSGDTEGFSLDVNYMMTDQLGNGSGISTEMLKTIEGMILKAENEMNERKINGLLGFTELPYHEEHLEYITQEAERISASYKNFVLIGIGGSSLGPIALHTALHSDYYNLLPPEKREYRPRVFFLENIDPDMMEGFLDFIEDDLEDTVFNVVTKSGGTAETLANFLIIRDAVSKRVGHNRFSEHFIVTTDPESGTLREIALEEHYQIFTIPKGVGGRFSVFTPVGLLPSAVSGIDIHSLLAGARYMDQVCQVNDIWQNPAYLKGALDYIAHVFLGKDIQVMMPYSHCLRDVADWHRQLWAESLGKRFDFEGKEVWAGSTPVKAIGVIDQHSQLQLYLEGPDDKIITFIAIKKHPKDVLIPQSFSEKKDIAYLGGHTLNELFEAERISTQYALLKASRMTSTITLNTLSPFTIGELFYFFELETAFVGFLYGINPFDQPGVEEGKRATYGMMGRPGFEGKRDEVEEMLKRRKSTYIISF